MHGARCVAVGQMTTLPCTLYLRAIYSTNNAAIIPKDDNDLSAIWMFCQSQDSRMKFERSKQSLEGHKLHSWSKSPSTSPTGKRSPPRNTPTACPSHTATTRPSGSSTAIPKARSSRSRSPSPACSATAGRARPAPVPRLPRPRPRRVGILCRRRRHRLPAAAQPRATRRGPPAPAPHRRPRHLRRARPDRRRRAEGQQIQNLEDWLRDEFFEQHSKLFHDRPFIWHLWDGRKDGFHALVNYHRLDQANLQKLTYSYLGNWIQQQYEDAKADKPGAAERLGAARALQTKLAAILEGEPPSTSSSAGSRSKTRP